MKTTLFLIGLIVIGVGAVMGVRTAQLDSRQPAVTAVSGLYVEAEAAAERLAAAVRIPTVSYQDPARLDSTAFRFLHTYLDTTYPAAHAVLEREVVGDLSLLYTWPGRDTTQAPILLAAHLDVVPVPDPTVWQEPPFAGVIADGYLWGRGTLDDKVGVLGILEAVEALARDEFQPERTVYLAFGHDEEVGGEDGAAQIAALLGRRGVRLAAALDEGGFVVDGLVPGMEQPVALVGIAEKGSVTLELRVDGEGGHSSTPPLRSPIGRLGAAVAALEQEQAPARLEGAAEQLFAYLAPEMPLVPRIVFANLWLTRPLVRYTLARQPSTNALIRTTTAPTVMRAGVKENVLPTTATALVNFRILPGETVDDVLAHATAVIDDPAVQVQIRPGSSARDPSAVSSADAAAFRHLQTTTRQVMGAEVVVAPYLVLAGTDGRQYEAVAENVYRFLPVPLGAEDLPRLHGADERIAVAAYADAVRFYYHLLRQMAGRP